MSTDSAPFKNFKVLPDDHRNYAAVGQVASNWAVLERTIDETIWHLALVLPALGACITAQLPGLHPRLRCLAALYALRQDASPQTVTDINTLIADSHGISQKRDRVVHDPWMFEVETGEVVQYTISADKRLNLGMTPMPAEEVRAIAAEIWQFHERSYALMERIKVEVSSFRDKARERLLETLRQQAP